MSHICHGDDPNEYPSGELTPGTIVFFLVAFLGIITLLLMSGCATPTSLPHRQEWELYRQANSPAAGACEPSQDAFYIYAADGTVFFLECHRGSSN